MEQTQEVKAKKKSAKHAPEGGNGPAAEKAPRDRTSRNFDKAAVVTLVSEKNPKRENSKSHARFALYRSGMTVGDFVTAGGSYGDLAWDSSRGFVTISGYTPKVVVKKEKATKADAPAA